MTTEKKTERYHKMEFSMIWRFFFFLIKKLDRS